MHQQAGQFDANFAAVPRVTVHPTCPGDYKGCFSPLRLVILIRDANRGQYLTQSSEANLPVNIQLVAGVQHVTLCATSTRPQATFIDIKHHNVNPIQMIPPGDTTCRHHSRWKAGHSHFIYFMGTHTHSSFLSCHMQLVQSNLDHLSCRVSI